MFGPMDMSRSGARVLMQPDTGVGFKDVVGVDNAKLVSSSFPFPPLLMNGTRERRGREEEWEGEEDSEKHASVAEEVEEGKSG